MQTKPSSLRPEKALKLFQKYEYLADHYAKKIFGYEKSGYEFSDILQEFKIKIYTSIQAYSRKYKEYKETGRYKPIALELYLKSALVNRANDFIKQFNGLSDDGVKKISWGTGIDVGYESNSTLEYSFRSCCLKVNGIDLCEGLITKDQKRCFIMYANGFSINKLQKTFAKKFSAKILIKNQVERLSLIKKELYNNSERKFEYFLSGDEN